MIWQNKTEKLMPILEKFIQDIHSNNQAENPHSLIHYILQWTNSQPELTEAICQLILKSNEPIKANEEELRVNQLVKTYLIDNWEKQEEAQEIRKVCDAILRSESKADLLIQYKQILKQQEVSVNNSINQKKLIDTGLVVIQQGKLTSANKIYQSVFNLNWINQTLSNLVPDLLEQRESQSTLLQGKFFNQRQLIISIIALAIILTVGNSIYLLLSTFTSDNRKPISKQVVPSSSTSTKKFYQKFQHVPNVPEGNFSYGGSTTLAPLRSDKVVNAIKKHHPEFNIEYLHPLADKPGSGTGIKQLLNGEISFSHSSRSIKTEEIEKAKSLGFRLEQKPIAIDGIAIYVNHNLPIKRLTLPQIRDIFTGKITNWKQVDGPDLTITPFSRNIEAGGTVDFFQEYVLGKEEETRTKFENVVKEVKNTTSSIKKVAETPGGIGYASASQVINQKSITPLPIAKNSNKNSSFIPPFSDQNIQDINQEAFINHKYPITRRLFVIVKKSMDSSIDLDQQVGEAYVNLMLSDEGQEWVEKQGFVPVRKVD